MNPFLEDFADTIEHKIRLDEANKRGIKIVVLKRTENVSTTKIIEGCLNG